MNSILALAVAFTTSYALTTSTQVTAKACSPNAKVGFEYVKDKVYGCSGQFSGGTFGLDTLCGSEFALCTLNDLKAHQFTADKCRLTPAGRFYAANVSSGPTGTCDGEGHDDLWGCTRAIATSCFPNEARFSGIKCNLLNGVIRDLSATPCNGWKSQGNNNEALTTSLSNTNHGGALCCSTTHKIIKIIKAKTSSEPASQMIAAGWKVDLFWASVVIFWISCGFCCAGMMFALYGARVQSVSQPLLQTNASSVVVAVSEAPSTQRNSMSSEISFDKNDGAIIEEEILHTFSDLDRRVVTKGSRPATMGSDFPLETFLKDIDTRFTVYESKLASAGFDTKSALKLLQESDCQFLEIPLDDLHQIIQHAQALNDSE